MPQPHHSPLSLPTYRSGAILLYGGISNLDSESVNVGQVLTIVIPALGAYLAAWLQNRKDKRQEESKREALAQQMFASQSDKLNAGWSDMTAQAREMINRLLLETIDAKTRAALAEDRADDLAKEIVECRLKYEGAIRQLEELRSIRPAS